MSRLTLSQQIKYYRSLALRNAQRKACKLASLSNPSEHYSYSDYYRLVDQFNHLDREYIFYPCGFEYMPMINFDRATWLINELKTLAKNFKQL